MMSFEDGPAQGQHLMLRRAPIYLRVVECAGKFDGLDQLTDTARPEEKIYAYKMEGGATMSFVCKRGGGGGPYPCATYRFIAQQPDDSTLRDHARWCAWTEATAAASQHGPS